MKGKVIPPETFLRASCKIGMRVFGERIQRCRGQTGRSVLEAARLGGIGPNVWTEVEAGRSTDIWKLLEALARGLGVSSTELGVMAGRCNLMSLD